MLISTSFIWIWSETYIHFSIYSTRFQISKIQSRSSQIVGSRSTTCSSSLSLYSVIRIVPLMKMRFLGELAESPFLVSRLNPNSSAKGYGDGGGFIGGWVDRCHGFLHNTVLVAASLFFVAYLAYEAKKSLSKLSNRRSYIMIAYYGCLWLVSLLNLAWCCLQVCSISISVL